MPSRRQSCAHHRCRRRHAAPPSRWLPAGVATPLRLSYGCPSNRWHPGGSPSPPSITIRRVAAPSSRWPPPSDCGCHTGAHPIDGTQEAVRPPTLYHYQSYGGPIVVMAPRQRLPPPSHQSYGPVPRRRPGGWWRPVLNPPLVIVRPRRFDGLPRARHHPGFCHTDPSSDVSRRQLPTHLPDSGMLGMLPGHSAPCHTRGLRPRVLATHHPSTNIRGRLP